MTQTQMWEIFWKSQKTISEHINNIYNELGKEYTMQKIANIWKTGNILNKPTNYYNLDVIHLAYIMRIEKKLIF